MVIFFALLFCFFLVVLLLKMSPKHRAEILSSVSKYKKAVIYFMEMICVLDKRHLSMRYNAVGHKFKVNQSTIYIK